MATEKQQPLECLQGLREETIVVFNRFQELLQQWAALMDSAMKASQHTIDRRAELPSWGEMLKKIRVESLENTDSVPTKHKFTAGMNLMVRRDGEGKVLGVRDIHAKKQSVIIEALFALNGNKSGFKYAAFKDAVDDVYDDVLGHLTGVQRRNRRYFCVVAGHNTCKSISTRLEALAELEALGKLQPEKIPSRLRQVINMIRKEEPDIYGKASFADIRRIFDREGVVFGDWLPKQVIPTETDFPENWYQLSLMEIYLLSNLLLGKEAQEAGIILDQKLTLAIEKILVRLNHQKNVGDISDDVIETLGKKIKAFLDKEKKGKIFLANEGNRDAQVVLLPLVDTDPQKIIHLLGNFGGLTRC